MDFSALPAHETSAAFESHEPADFENWVLDRSAEVVRAARRIHGDAQQSSASQISDIDLVIVRNTLGYAANLEVLHGNLVELTMRLMAHHSGRTAEEVRRLDMYKTTAGLLLTGLIVFYPQDVIDTVSYPNTGKIDDTDIDITATSSCQHDRPWPAPALSPSEAQHSPLSANAQSDLSPWHVEGDVLRAALFKRSSLR